MQYFEAPIYSTGLVVRGPDGEFPDPVAFAIFDDARERPEDLVAILANYDIRDVQKDGTVTFSDIVANKFGFQAYTPEFIYTQLVGSQSRFSPSNTEWQTIANGVALQTFADFTLNWTFEAFTDVTLDVITGPLLSNLASKLTDDFVLQVIFEKTSSEVFDELITVDVTGPSPGFPTVGTVLREEEVAITALEYVGNDAAISFFDAPFQMVGQNTTVRFDPGIFISTGGGFGTLNTSPGTTVDYPEGGDADLDRAINSAFSVAGSSEDAASITVELDVKSPVIAGFSLDLIFMSEEYPEYADTEFVDIAAVFVNDRNIALFNEDTDRPLSVLQANIDDGNFYDNDPFGSSFAEGFQTEFDGVSRPLNVFGELRPGSNTIKIAIADTGDGQFDSGLYISNLRLLTSDNEGLFVRIDGTEAGGNLLGTSSRDSIFGLFAPDIILPGLGRDIVQTGDGADVVAGTLVELDGDIITDFSTTDTIRFLGLLFDQDALTVTTGSAILDFDVNGDGVSDATVTLEGEFEDAVFNVEVVGENTEITVEFPPEFNPVDGTSDSDNLVGTDGADAIRSLAGSYDKMMGGADADQFIFGAEANNGVRERDVILDYEVGIDSIVLEDGASVLSVRDSSGGAVVFLEGDRDAIYVRGDGVTADNLTIITEDVFEFV